MLWTLLSYLTMGMLGDIEVKLFNEDNPVTVSNFLENIDNNIYVNQKFYKIINFPQITFIQGGVNPENKFYIERNQIFKKRWIHAICR